jgi:primase-polymerase (primpol)-like protein
MDSPYKLDPDAIPEELTQQKQWVCWKTEHRKDQDGNTKKTKTPINPRTGQYASVTNPDTWTRFETAYNTYRDPERELDVDVDGIGFVFTREDPYIGVDLDNCRDLQTGELADWAKDVIQRLDSYTEASPSGTGIHIIAQGEPPTGRNRRGDIELYNTDRYFTVTGQHLSLTPKTVNERTAELREIHEEHLENSEYSDYQPPQPVENTLSDDELLERARNAGNGHKFSRLWNGDTTGYKSHSEADQALCNLLAFWTGGDKKRIEHLFSQSGLAREKWRERSDYRERTIRNAVQDATDYYEDTGVTEKTN